MADRFDENSSKTGDQLPDDDPLAELARIIGFDQPPAKAQPAPASADSPATSEEEGIDLEAELLAEFEAGEDDPAVSDDLTEPEGDGMAASDDPALTEAPAEPQDLPQTLGDVEPDHDLSGDQGDQALAAAPDASALPPTLGDVEPEEDLSTHDPQNGASDLAAEPDALPEFTPAIEAEALQGAGGAEEPAVEAEGDVWQPELLDDSVNVVADNNFTNFTDGPDGSAEDAVQDPESVGVDDEADSAFLSDADSLLAEDELFAALESELAISQDVIDESVSDLMAEDAAAADLGVGSGESVAADDEFDGDWVGNDWAAEEDVVASEADTVELSADSEPAPASDSTPQEEWSVSDEADPDPGFETGETGSDADPEIAHVLPDETDLAGSDEVAMANDHNVAMANDHDAAMANDHDDIFAEMSQFDLPEAGEIASSLALGPGLEDAAAGSDAAPEVVAMHGEAGSDSPVPVLGDEVDAQLFGDGVTDEIDPDGLQAEPLDFAPDDDVPDGAAGDDVDAPVMAPADTDPMFDELEAEFDELEVEFDDPAAEFLETTDSLETTDALETTDSELDAEPDAEPGQGGAATSSEPEDWRAGATTVGGNDNHAPSVFPDAGDAELTTHADATAPAVERAQLDTEQFDPGQIDATEFDTSEFDAELTEAPEIEAASKEDSTETPREDVSTPGVAAAAASAAAFDGFFPQQPVIGETAGDTAAVTADAALPLAPSTAGDQEARAEDVAASSEAASVSDTDPEDALFSNVDWLHSHPSSDAEPEPSSAEAVSESSPSEGATPGLDVFDARDIGETGGEPELTGEIDVPTLPIDEPEAGELSGDAFDSELDREFARLVESETEKDFAVGSDASKAAAIMPVAGAAALDDPDYTALAATLDDKDGEAAASNVRPRPVPVDADAAEAVAVQPAARGAGASSKRGPLAAGVVLGVAVLFGGVAIAWNYLSGEGDGEGGPQIIRADKDPVKVAPQDPGGTTVPNQDKAVYEQVAGQTDGAPSQERLVESAEEPVDVVQRTLEPDVLPADALPLEGRAEKDEDRLTEADTAEPASDSAASGTLLAPRRVKTMIVRPDGTIVPREEDPVPAASAASDPAPAAGEEAAQTADATPAATRPAAPVTENTAPANAAVDSAAAEPDAAATDEAPGEGAVAASDAALADLAAAPTDETQTAEPVAPVTETAAATPPATTFTAPVPESRPADQPVNVVGRVAGNGQATEPAQTVSAPAVVNPGGYYVQIASQPSRDAAEATYASLSQRYAGIIGNRGVDYQRADIPGKGIYHRVRIPGGSRDDANRLCSRYKSAGGSCFVTR
ncbi:SPOR domain-containing protein [Pseudohoeflea coraliihabitans]|uniref:SPOR domain-containing protein n=1 Tax=Pseudohoeflea coraliihabitans TaxID=2860393 RepID=A0ABS6WQ71_9HYPH|nr:SPOR domain-containing protein [Pseudohoeflea sp. DP4N28-3]MBW3098117.1 SPOR domain-containing protein [Pseudohoeflea sp. DP4N28-3]